MRSSMNRRHWLQKSALLTGGITIFGSFISKIAAHPKKLFTPKNVLSDKTVILNSKPELKARLFANENPFGPSVKAKQAINDSLTKSFRYSFMEARELATQITEAEGLTLDHILPAAGSTQLLVASAMLFAKNGGKIITADPSYADLPENAEFFSGQWIKIPLKTDFTYDLEAMEKAVDEETSLVYICNPNNPTGTIADPVALKSFCERVSKKVPVFIDEAYYDYLPNPEANTMVGCIKEGHNVIIARTFSKIYGFAGLRVGFALAQPEMIEQISMYCPGVNSLSVTSISAAAAAFGDEAYKNEVIRKTTASKAFLYKVLEEEGYSYIPSSANFVLFPIKMEGPRFAEEMMKRGVGIRHWQINEQAYCRVSIGTMEEMEYFAKAFREIS